MTAHLPPLTLIRLWAALLLAAICGQAVQPFQAPLEAQHGSAFSAATYEVAVAPQRRVEAQQALPAVLPPMERAELPLAPRPRFLAAPPARPLSTGPPAGDILARQPAPRAPPIA